MAKNEDNSNHECIKLVNTLGLGELSVLRNGMKKRMFVFGTPTETGRTP